jgi:hypothetical protein
LSLRARSGPRPSPLRRPVDHGRDTHHPRRQQARPSHLHV